MDPDKFQMRDLKRRVTRLEDQIGYMKTDTKRVTLRINALQGLLTQHGCHDEHCKHQEEH